MSDLRTAVQTYSAAPDCPSRLFTCPFSPETLVYADCRPNKQVVKWLDCSSYPPSLKDVRTNIQLQLADNCFVEDMCFVTHGGKHLLVTTHFYGGVHGYVVGTDELEWRISYIVDGCHPDDMYAMGITSNGQGQLFICECILNGSVRGRVCSSRKRFWTLPNLNSEVSTLSDSQGYSSSEPV